MRRIKTLLAMVAAGLVAGTASLYSQPALLVGITNHNWQYFTTPGGPAAGWQNVGFDDSTWLTGRGLFGSDTGYPYPFVSVFQGPGNAATPGPNVAFFRTTFNWPGSLIGVVLTLTNFVDDGAVFYLNGTELMRTNMPDQATVPLPDYSTFAPGTISEGTTRVYQLNLDSLANGNANPLVSGVNVLAASVHNNNSTSSDTVFGLAVVGAQAVAPCTPAAPANVTAVQCRNATFTAVIPANCGVPSPTLQWFRNVAGTDEAITDATGISLTVSNVQAADAGQYFFQLSNASGTTSSGRGQLIVTADNQGPRVSSVVFEGGAENTFVVTYDEPVHFQNATDAFNYIFVGSDGHQIQAGNVTQDAVNLAIVRVTATEGLRAGVPYSYFIGNDSEIQDACSQVGTPVGTLTGSVLQRATILHWTDGRSWRFNQSGADQGTAWRDVVFDDSTWEVGPQGFGNEGGGFPDAPDSQRTPLTRSVTQITYYFRTTFTVPAGAQNVRIGARVDDGAAIYVNGTEVGRVNIAANLTLLFNTLTPNLFDPENTGYMPADGILIPSSLLVSGNNVLAIEVHQNSTTSSDVIMLARIQAEVAAIVVEPPVITEDPVSTTVTEGHTFRFSALASGSSVTYQWYKVGTPDTAIPGATSSSYTAVANSTSGGGYYVKASNGADSDQSATATLTVRPVVATYGTIWKYSIDSQDLTLAGGTPWYAPAFDDTAWPSGPGPLGIETTAATIARLPAPIATALPAPSATFLTSYFRTTVNVPTLSAGQTLVLTHLVDDGAAIYLDGALAIRYNMTAPAPIYSTNVAPATAPGDGDANMVSIPVTLSPGNHTIAAEVHQNAAGSSDIMWGAELRVITSTAPTLTITHPVPGTIQLSWTPDPLYSLFSSANVAGTYTRVAGNPQGSLTVTSPTAAATFYRIQLNGQ